MAEKTFRAGAATSVITPPLGAYIVGGFVPRPCESVHDDLHVRTLVLDDGKTRLAFAVCDLVAIGSDIIDPAKKLIEKRTGISPQNVLVSATHTHSGPGIRTKFENGTADPAYVAWLPSRIADAVRIAAGRLEPARIGWGKGSESKLVFNRRYYMKPGTVPVDPFGQKADKVKTNPGTGNPDVLDPAGPIDPDVLILAVESAGGRPISVLGNYALHYVGGTGPGQISADYFAAWASAILRLAGVSSPQKYPPFVPILTNGCSGDINNIDVKGQRRKSYRPYEKMTEVAGQLAAESYRVWRKIEFHDWVELAASAEQLDLAIRKPNADELSQAEKIVSEIPAGEAPKTLPQVYAFGNLILAKSYPDRVKAPVHAFRMGSFGLATFPGEAFVEMGLEVKKQSPYKTTMLVELANDYHGYIPTVRAHEDGGYETWRKQSSCLEIQAAPKMVDSALRQLHQLMQG